LGNVLDEKVQKEAARFCMNRDAEELGEEDAQEEGDTDDEGEVAEN